MENIELRPEGQDDAEFLYELFASIRADEMALTGWDEDAREKFLRSQLALQTHHYQTYYPNTRFDIIMESNQRVGRLYVERGSDGMVIHDIALIPTARGRGIGSYLLSKLIDEASNSRLLLQIFVEQHNPAMNLYVRLGFNPVKLEGIYYLMERPPVAEQAAVLPS
jgi:ribosomal protein S18 acetylase RimI-like enzyme